MNIWNDCKKTPAPINQTFLVKYIDLRDPEDLYNKNIALAYQGEEDGEWSFCCVFDPFDLYRAIILGVKESGFEITHWSKISDFKFENEK